MKFFFAFSVVILLYTPFLKAQQRNVDFIDGNVRFTVISSGFIRMEYAEDGKFEDRASLTFVNRKYMPTPFTTKLSKSELVLKTSEITLTYKRNSGAFTAKNLKIDWVSEGKKGKWDLSVNDSANILPGTTRTLDAKNGEVPLEPSILSRSGFTFIDDSRRPLFDNSEYPWVLGRDSANRCDYYFLAYGNNYKKALADFVKAAGNIPIPPRFAFGVWFSKFWGFTSDDFLDIAKDAQSHSVPLDVMVIDMDWHITMKPEFYDSLGQRARDQSGQKFGWTGFTFSPHYFPDYKRWIKQTNDIGLKTCMNLHPASGIQPHEAQYEDFARSMGQDPAEKKYVPFDITDKKFAKNYMEVLLHPYEDLGIDFWWLDWQQWGNTKIEGVNPTFYLNYVHFSDMARRNKVRPLIFHRWGGLGNHRYQIGFSGDHEISWKSLNFQPKFTASASNVCFGYWSHDIGGHNKGTHEDRQSPELFTRWVQWGAFSPIFRTHATKDQDLDRRIWTYPYPYQHIMREALELRYALVPYIYSMAFKANQTGLSIIRPLYYEQPTEPQSYSNPNTYYFGDDLLFAPVTQKLGEYTPASINDSLAFLESKVWLKMMKPRGFNFSRFADSVFVQHKVWLPKGNWFHYQTGKKFNGQQYITMPVRIEDLPLFVREGAILPKQPKLNRLNDLPEKELVLEIFPGSGETTVYEDAGNDNQYLNKQYSLRNITSITDPSKKSVKVSIGASNGSYVGMAKLRDYKIKLMLTLPAKSITVNGTQYDVEKATYCGKQLANIITITDYPTDKPLEVVVTFMDGDASVLYGLPGLRNLFHFALHNMQGMWQAGFWYEFDESLVINDFAAGATLNQRIAFDKPNAYATAVKMRELYDKTLPILKKAIDGRPLNIKAAYDYYSYKW